MLWCVVRVTPAARAPSSSSAGVGYKIENSVKSNALDSLTLIQFCVRPNPRNSDPDPPSEGFSGKPGPPWHRVGPYLGTPGWEGGRVGS